MPFWREKPPVKTFSVALTAWLCVLTLPTVSANAQSASQSPPEDHTNEGQTACRAAAMADYNKASLALVQPGPPM